MSSNKAGVDGTGKYLGSKSPVSGLVGDLLEPRNNGLIAQ